MISNSSKFSNEIISELSPKMEILLFKYDLDFLSNFVSSNNVDLILMHFASLSNEDVISFHKILTGETFNKLPKVFLGDEMDYRDHVSTWGGRFAGVILTPVVLSELYQKIDQFLQSKSVQPVENGGKSLN